MIGVVAERLVAERDCNVIETGLRITICGLLVITHGVLRTSHAYAQVAHAVVERELYFRLVFCAFLEDNEIDRHGLIPFLALLVATSLVFQLRDGLHAFCDVVPSAVIVSNSRFDSSRPAVLSFNFSRSAAAPHTSSS